jgi:hypothetical protein
MIACFPDMKYVRMQTVVLSLDYEEFRSGVVTE